MQSANLTHAARSCGWMIQSHKCGLLFRAQSHGRAAIDDQRLAGHETGSLGIGSVDGTKAQLTEQPSSWVRVFSSSCRMSVSTRSRWDRRLSPRTTAPGCTD